MKRFGALRPHHQIQKYLTTDSQDRYSLRNEGTLASTRPHRALADRPHEVETANAQRSALAIFGEDARSSISHRFTIRRHGMLHELRGHRPGMGCSSHQWDACQPYQRLQLGEKQDSHVCAICHHAHLASQRPAIYVGQRDNFGQFSGCCFRLRPFTALGGLQARVHACIDDGARLEEEDDDDDDDDGDADADDDDDDDDGDVEGHQLFRPQPFTQARSSPCARNGSSIAACNHPARCESSRPAADAYEHFSTASSLLGLPTDVVHVLMRCAETAYAVQW